MMRLRLWTTSAAAVAAAVIHASSASHAQAPAPDGPRVDFATDIQPIFRQHCVSCHGPREQKNGLRLDRRKDAMRGGTIAVIGPGNAAGSRLYHRLTGDKFGIRMPPTGPLPADLIAKIKRWIDQGAEWPDAVAGDAPPVQPDPAAVAIAGLLRSGDTTRVAAAVTADPAVINKPGPGGATALMTAALYGDSATLHALIERGADVNATDEDGATALMWAVTSVENTRLLLDRGANVNAQSADGRTPLLIAAGLRGAAPVVRLLLDNGARIRVRAPSLFGDTTPLVQAAYNGDGETFALLVERGAELDAVAPIALGLAQRSGCRTCADLAAKVVGPAGFTGLLSAVVPPGDSGEAVPMLLKAGADPKTLDGDGRSLLMLAAASESAPVDAVKVLIAAGLDVNARDAAGRTALTYARMQGKTPVVTMLEQMGAVDGSPASLAPANYRPATSARAAVERSLPLLQQADEQFLHKAACVSCHNNSLAAMTVSLARSRGIGVNEEIARRQLDAVSRYLHTWRGRALQGIGIPGDNTTISYILVGLAGENAPADRATDAMARFLRYQQLPSGAWLPLANRPPIEGNTVQSTALTMMALKAYMPPAERDAHAAAIARAAAWLKIQRPTTNEGRVFQLFGLQCGGADDGTLRQFARDLVAQQRADGGWAQLPTLASDAYATGQALVALAKTGTLPVRSAAFRKGVQYLLKTQFADGSWYVRSRSIPIQPHFDAGFPYGKDQFISTAATNWAAMALTFAADTGSQK